MAGRSSGIQFKALVRRLRVRDEDEVDDDSEYSSDDDSSGWETDDSFPDPDELADMPNTGPGFDWKRVSKLVKGPLCWKCVCLNGKDIYSPFFGCAKCGRHFHRECVFMDPGYPYPVFDRSLEDACMSNHRSKVNLLKCPVCIVSEETHVSSMLKHSRKEINEALSLIAGHMIVMYGAVLNDPKLATGNATHITVDKILEKTKNDEYLTVEGFYDDFKMMKLNFVRKFGKESEANEVVDTVIEALGLQMYVAIECLSCVKKSFDETGKLCNQREYGRNPIREPCPIPHLLIWVKEAGYPFWPAKVLSHTLVKKKMSLVVQYFGERPGVKVLPFPDNKICYKTFSSEFPEKRLDQKSDGFSKWKVALTESRGYLMNMRKKYGDDGVVIPVEAGVFSGDLDECVMKMFPKYVEVENEELAEAPADQLELGSLQIESNNDLLEQADDDLVPQMQGEENGE